MIYVVYKTLKRKTLPYHLKSPTAWEKPESCPEMILPYFTYKSLSDLLYLLWVANSEVGVSSAQK